MCFSLIASHTSRATATGFFRGQFTTNIHEQTSKDEKRTSGCLVSWRKPYLMWLDDWSDLAQCYASCLVSRCTKPPIKHSMSSIPCVRKNNCYATILNTKLPCKLHSLTVKTSKEKKKKKFSSCFHSTADSAIFFALANHIAATEALKGQCVRRKSPFIS